MPTGEFMAEAIAAAYGYEALYAGAVSFYAGYTAVTGAYDTYKKWFPTTSETHNAKGEFTPGGTQRPYRRRRIVRKRYRRRYY